MPFNTFVVESKVKSDKYVLIDDAMPCVPDDNPLTVSPTIKSEDEETFKIPLRESQDSTIPEADSDETVSSSK